MSIMESVMICRRQGTSIVPADRVSARRILGITEHEVEVRRGDRLQHKYLKSICNVPALVDVSYFCTPYDNQYRLLFASSLTHCCMCKSARSLDHCSEGLPLVNLTFLRS